MIPRDTAVVHLLCVDSSRIIDLGARTVQRITGARDSPVWQPHAPVTPFERIVPWPPVPGMPIDIVWKWDGEHLSASRTSMVLAAWSAGQRDQRWRSESDLVLEDDIPRLRAVTAQAAHSIAIAMATSSSASRGLPVPTFSVRDDELACGADVVARALENSALDQVAARLSGHPASPILGPAIAVAADETMNAYRIDPTWQMRDGPQPWPRRVEAAALWSGAIIAAEGDLHTWRWNGTYRHVPCGASWDGNELAYVLDGHRQTAIKRPIDGPLTAVGLLMDAIDRIDEVTLLRRALDQPL